MSILLFSITISVNFFFIFIVFPKLSIIFKYFGLTIFLVQIISQLYTMLVNPGIPNKNNYVSDGVMQIIYQNMKLSGLKFDNYRICKLCNILVKKEDNVIHCEDCEICVKGNFKNLSL